MRAQSDESTSVGDVRAAEEPASTVRRDRLLTVLLVLGASIVPITLAVRGVIGGWYPIGDDAVIAVRTFDVLSARTPFTGQGSLAGRSAGVQTFSAGPLGYWIMAIPSRFLPIGWLPLAVAAWHTAVIAVTVTLARRLGGWTFAVGLAVMMALAARALNPYVWISAWNPSLAMTSVLLLFLVSWACLLGRTWWFPAAVFLASFLLQAHAIYVPVALVWFVPAALATVVALVRGRPRRSAPPGASTMRLFAPLLAGVLLGLAVWVLPIADQLAGTGNLGHLRQAAAGRGEPIGEPLIRSGLDQVLGVPPLWTVRGDRFDGVPGATGGALWLSPAAWVVGLALVGVGGWALRRRDARLRAGSALAVGGLVAVVAATATVPADSSGVLYYVFRWFVPLSVAVWAVLFLAGLRLLDERALRSAGERTPAESPAGVSSGHVIAAVLLTVFGTVVGIFGPVSDAVDRSSGEASLRALVLGGTTRGRTYAVREQGPRLGSLGTVVLELRRAGRDPIVRPGGEFPAEFYGDSYVPSGARCDGVVVLRPPGSGTDGRILGETELVDARTLEHHVIEVALLQDDAPNGLC